MTLAEAGRVGERDTGAREDVAVELCVRGGVSVEDRVRDAVRVCEAVLVTVRSGVRLEVDDLDGDARMGEAAREREPVAVVVAAADEGAVEDDSDELCDGLDVAAVNDVAGILGVGVPDVDTYDVSVPSTVCEAEAVLVADAELGGVTDAAGVDDGLCELATAAELDAADDTLGVDVPVAAAEPDLLEDGARDDVEEAVDAAEADELIEGAGDDVNIGVPVTAAELVELTEAAGVSVDAEVRAAVSELVELTVTADVDVNVAVFVVAAELVELIDSAGVDDGDAVGATTSRGATAGRATNESPSDAKATVARDSPVALSSATASASEVTSAWPTSTSPTDTCSVIRDLPIPSGTAPLVTIGTPGSANDGGAYGAREMADARPRRRAQKAEATVVRSCRVATLRRARRAAAGVGDGDAHTGTIPVTVTSVADTTNVSFVSRPAKMASMADAVAGSSTPEP